MITISQPPFLSRQRTLIPSFDPSEPREIVDLALDLSAVKAIEAVKIGFLATSSEGIGAAVSNIREGFQYAIKVTSTTIRKLALTFPKWEVSLPKC
jgi:hypothetical protein